MCLQETKCIDEKFPHRAFRALGYAHMADSGQKGYHGVATISRRPIEARASAATSAKRATAVTSRRASRRRHNAICCTTSTCRRAATSPNPEINLKFRHKLDFVEEMTRVQGRPGRGKSRRSW